jgi:hypothetical protein
MSTKDILTLAIATLGAGVALATLIAACLEYVRQGKMARVQMFFDLRSRLKEPELWKLAELIDEANTPDPKVSKRGGEALEEIPFRVKRDYLGLFEEVALAMDWGLIDPDVAHYMFGYYALHCANCSAFWIDVGKENPYWDRFRKFCDRMEEERKIFERELGEIDRHGFGGPPAQPMPAGTDGRR